MCDSRLLSRNGAKRETALCIRSQIAVMLASMAVFVIKRLHHSVTKRKRYERESRISLNAPASVRHGTEECDT